MTHEPGTGRVLLTLDCGSIDEDALKALTLLTEGTDVQLTGLFVEDEDLYQAAELPGLTEVSASGARSVLEQGLLARRIAAEAQQARAGFEAFAKRLGLNFSFQVTRGRWIETLLAAATATDLVVVNRSLRATGLRTRAARHFAPLLQQHQNVLFVNEPWRSGSSIVCLSERNEGAGRRALNLAARLARAEELKLVVAVPAGFDRSTLRDIDEVTVVEDWTEAALVALCEAADARLLVLPPSERLDWRSLLTGLADRLSCSLLRLG
jgi:hypothetical protein